MNQVLIQLIYFVIYSVVFLVIGKLSFSESDSLSKFFVGERKNDEKRLFFTFVGTWVSAATILGFTGNVYHSGLSVIASSVIPWFIGAGLLYLMTDRLYENDVLSIPQLIGKKHDSKFVLETGIPVTKNKNRINRSNDFCSGSCFCTCAGTA